MSSFGQFGWFLGRLWCSDRAGGLWYFLLVFVGVRWFLARFGEVWCFLLGSRFLFFSAESWVDGGKKLELVFIRGGSINGGFVLLKGGPLSKRFFVQISTFLHNKHTRQNRPTKSPN